MTVTIQLSEEQAMALRAKAEAEGLSLEKWFQKLADDERLTRERASVVEEMRALRARVKPDPEGWATRDYVNYGRR